MSWRIINDADGDERVLECEDMQTLHDALGLHLERLQGLSRAQAGMTKELDDDPVVKTLRELSEAYAKESGVDMEQVDAQLQGTLALDFMRAKKLREALVELVGEDLTGGGC